MIPNIMIILILVIILLLTLLLITYIQLQITRKEYHTFKSNKYRDSNKILMVEYYLRNYKEGENIHTVFRDLIDLIYNEE